MLKVKGSDNDTRYFNTSFLSKFVNEEEAFFIGNDNHYLIFDDIIDYKIGYKFDRFLKGLNIIYSMMRGDWYRCNNPIDDKLQKLVQRLILYQLSLSNSTDINYVNNDEIPEYIRKIWYFVHEYK